MKAPPPVVLDLKKQLKDSDEADRQRARVYWKLQADCVRGSQDAFDKAVMTLSGGALGVSFAFVKTFLTGPVYELGSLRIAWACWVASLALMLSSHYLSVEAHTGNLRKLAAWKPPAPLPHPGNRWDTAVHWCNALAGAAFVAGAASAGWFVNGNLR